MLTDREIKALTPKDAPYKVADGDGLFLNITPSGNRSWIFRYKLGGKSGSIGLGAYPKVGARVARALRDSARKDVAAGRKPDGARAVERGELGTTMHQMLKAWYDSEEARWSPHFRQEVWSRLERNVLARMGDLVADQVTPKLLLDLVLVPIKERSHDQAQRCRQHLQDAFGYGIANGMVTRNPALEAKEGLGKKRRGGRRPAIIELEPAREMLRRIEAQPAFPVVRLANRFFALTAVRPGEGRGARWEEFNGLDGAEPVWVIPEERAEAMGTRVVGMKMRGRGEFVVPLSRQAVDVLEAACTLSGRLPFVFPHTLISRKPLSENAVGYLINRAGYAGRHCAHGWRSAFSTVMNDLNPADEPIIEASLAHQKDDEIAGAYNRGEYLRHRRRLMQAWADLLMAGMPSAKTLLEGPIRSAPPYRNHRAAA